MSNAESTAIVTIKIRKKKEKKRKQLLNCMCQIKPHNFMASYDTESDLYGIYVLGSIYDGRDHCSLKRF